MPLLAGPGTIVTAMTCTAHGSITDELVVAGAFAAVPAAVRGIARATATTRRCTLEPLLVRTFQMAAATLCSRPRMMPRVRATDDLRDA